MKNYRFHLDHLVCLILPAALTLLWTPHAYLLDFSTALLLLCPGLVLLAVAVYRREPRLIGCCLAFLGFVLSLSYFHYHALSALRQAEQIAALPKVMTLEFNIREVLRQTDYQTLVATARLTPDLPAQRIYLRWQLPQPVYAGERWQGEVRLRPLASRLNDGGFDRQQWAFANGISAEGTVKSAVKIGAEFSWREQRLQRALQQTEGLSARGLLLALGFGERAWLDAERWRIYQHTNTAHLIAISGLHIGLAMLMGVGVVRGVQLFLPTRRIGPHLPLLGGLAMAWGYAALAGFSIPTLRAITALAVICLFRFGRGYGTAWQMLLRVAALLLIMDPLMLLSASFWLSVGAVAALILWYQCVPLALLYWRGRPLAESPLRKVRYVINLLHLQIGLLWLFTPLLLWQFNGISLSGFLANLIAVPLFSLLLVPLVLFAVIKQGGLHSWAAANSLAEWITARLSPLQNMWLALSVETSLICTALLSLLFGGGLLWLAVRRRKSARSPSLALLRSRLPFSLNEQAIAPAPVLRNGIAGSVLIVLLCLSAAMWERINRPLWRLETLDVGQGLATLLVKENNAVLYDTGAGWQTGSMAQTEIIPYLQRQGIELETLIISHDDNDHAGGAADILRRYPQAQFISPSVKNYGASDRTFCRRGRRWQWRGLSITALWPPETAVRADNPASCVLLVTDGHYKLLLTGDADVAAENRFAHELDKIHVLQVGHHGSKTATGSRLVERIRPDIALISSGRRNPWGFPHATVTARLKARQSAVYNTAVSGQIGLWFYPEFIKIRTARTDLAPWYRGLIGLHGK
ncbi:DNA internalization-related competence protein ComEC/Rec2 [Necropsobacter rosorum]|uniref:DNA internalization-related competence protein ComEC/Rec2 n=1 Tax=Necropsobacter rosorum TaxID=908285 RepID=UPI000A00315B